MLSKTYITADPVNFQTCFKCDRSGELSKTSVHFSRVSLATFSQLINGLDKLFNRSVHQLPICKRCRFPIWYIRLIHFILAIVCCLAPLWLSAILGDDAAMLPAILLATIGTFCVLVSYVAVRNWFLGVQVSSEGRRYCYDVANRYTAKFESELNAES